MKRRTLLRGGAGLLAAGAGLALARPGDAGAPHAEPFSRWNRLLREQGPGRPALLVDLDALEHNLEAVRRSLLPGRAFRVVVKSLPAGGLLARAMASLRTDRLMVFHGPHLRALAALFPHSDLLLGKPLPVQAAATFYAGHRPGAFDPASQLTWLVDTRERLAQYAALGRALGTRLRVSLEIDVGLHRGGLLEPAWLGAVVALLRGETSTLLLAGLMGYDAHVGKIPALLESQATSLARSQARYRAFQEALFALAPEHQGRPLVMNGAGSPTFRLHDARSPLNEVAAGSCLVKPSDFDLPSLADLRPAAFIAAPVLKALEGTTLPGLERASRRWALWDKNRARSYFLDGGLWMARPVSPSGLVDNGLYGKSSNQSLLNGSLRTALAADDQVFLRPTQSERVLTELGALLAVRGDALVERWEPLAP